MTRPVFEEYRTNLWCATSGVCAVEIAMVRDGFEVTPFVRERAREGPALLPDLDTAITIGEAMLERIRTGRFQPGDRLLAFLKGLG